MDRYGSSTARVAGPGRVNDPVPRQGARHGRAGNCATGGGARASADIGDADAAPVHGTREVTIWNTLLRGTSLSGVYDNVDGSDGYFTGTVNGSSVSITDIRASPGATASGTISGTTMSGTLSGNGVVYATWTSDTSC